MLVPPFITPTSGGEAARTAALLSRACGLLFTLYWLPMVTGGLGEIASAVFVDYDPALNRPGAGGYPSLMRLRLADVDLLKWFRSYGVGLLGFGVGLALLMRRYRGPTWGEIGT